MWTYSGRRYQVERPEPDTVLGLHEVKAGRMHAHGQVPMGVEDFSIVEDVTAAAKAGSGAAVRPVKPDPLAAAAGHPHELHGDRMACPQHTPGTCLDATADVPHRLGLARRQDGRGSCVPRPPRDTSVCVQ